MLLLRIFAFEKRDNCPWPYRMTFNYFAFESLFKARGNNIAFMLLRDTKKLLINVR